MGIARFFRLPVPHLAAPALVLAAAVLTPAAAQGPRALLAPAPLASTAMAASGGAVPDTTDWRAYFPLEVGNRWQYRIDDGQFVSYVGYDIVADTTIEGERYSMLRTCQRNAAGDPVYCTDEDPNPALAYDYLRYDTTYALVVERYESGGEGYETWWQEVPCALDAPFSGAPLWCDGPDAYQRYFVTGGYGYTVVVGADTLRNRTYKEFDGEPNYIITGMVAGLGTLFRQYIKGSTSVYSLVYARVGGAEVGEEAFAFPSAAEPEPQSGTVAVWPNPARGTASIRLTVPTSGDVRVEIVDVLGRTVRALGLGPRAVGLREVPLDLGALPPGHYFVRILTNGRPPATLPLTVVR